MNTQSLVTRARRGGSRSALARRAGTSPATLHAYESGRVDPGTATLSRVLSAAGLALETQLVAAPYADEAERAAELQDVLELADQFPTRPAASLAFPPLPRG